MAYGTAANNVLATGFPDRAVDMGNKSLAVAVELGDSEKTAMALVPLGMALCELGDANGLQELKRALELFEEWDTIGNLPVCMINLGEPLWLFEGPAAGLELHRRAIDVAGRRGGSYFAMWAKAQSSWMLADLGLWEELITTANEVSAWARAHDQAYTEAIVLPYAAWVHAKRGNGTEAIALEGRFLPAAREIGDPQALVPALAVASLIRQNSGEKPLAVDLIEELGKLTSNRPNWRARFLPELLRVLIERGLGGMARAFMPEPTSVGSARDRHSVLSARAILAEAEGEPEEALLLYQDATHRWADYGCVLERGQCLLGIGRCLVALARLPQAMTSLREARKLFAGLEARPLVEAADFELLACGCRKLDQPL